MQTISYKQACEILGVKYVTIKDAVLYGRLTRCAGVTGSLLLREQVELFKNKKISPNSLTLEEKELWEEYKKIAENAELLRLAISGPVQQSDNNITAIIKQIQSRGQEYTITTKDQFVQECNRLVREINISIRLEEKESELSYPL